MAKRGAEEQITKDGPAADYNDNANGHPTYASSDVLAKRKILKPRGKMFNLQTKASPSLPSNPKGTDKDAKLKALGISFANAVKKVKLDDGVADFRPFVNLYLKYYADIENGTLPTTKPLLTKAAFGTQTSSSPNAPSPVPQSTSFAPKVDVGQALQKSNTSDMDDDDDDEDSQEDKKDIKIQGPQFNLTTKPTIKNSPFTFGAAKKPESDSDSEIEIKGPTFTFNKEIKDPVFKLSENVKSIAKDASSKENNDQKAAAFSFGLKAGAPSDKPKFSFGSSTASSSFDQFKLQDQGGGSSATNFFLTAKPFQFGLNQNVQKELELSQKQSNEKGAKQLTFEFGTTPDNKTDTNENTKPVFSFNSTSETTADKSVPPSFKFGNNLGNTTFGSSTNIGSVPSIFNSTTGSQKLNDQESAISENASFKSNGEARVSGAEIRTGGETEEVENPNIHFEAVASLNDKKLEVQSGEESETIVFQRKTKLMLFNAEDKENPYKTLGKGELKVLHSEGKGSGRVLVRADGSLRVLLNVSLIKDLSYSTLGNGSLVRVPVVNADKKIDTYVLKVKSPEDGQELCKILNDTKSR